MAFNAQTFRIRTLTSAVFVIVMLAGLLINRWTFLILFSIIHFGCWWEYLKLIEKIQAISFSRALKFGFMFLGYAIMLAFFRSNYAMYVSGSLAVFGVGLLIFGFIQKKAISLKSFSAAILGVAYISLSWGTMMGIYYWEYYSDPSGDFLFQHKDAIFLPSWLIASIWINDTMAYVVGSFIGKTPLSKISPKKTWEGTVSGILITVLTSAIVASIIFKSGYHALLFLSGISAIATIIGTFGDLFESKLKRMARVKDSGHIMPGHGGFLDRFDSLLLATPFVWLYVYFFTR